MNRLFIIILFALCANSLFAQSGFNIQLMAEPQSKMVNGDYYTYDVNGDEVAMKKEFAIGFQGGVAFEYGFTDNMGISLGFLYSSQGQNYKDYVISQNGESLTEQHSLALNYLKIPLQFNFSLPSSGSITFAGFAGFYYAPLLNYTDKISAQFSDGSGYTWNATISASGTTANTSTTETYLGNTQSSSTPYALSDEAYTASDFGVTLGAGMQVKLSDKIWMPIMVNYQTGFSDIKNRSALIIGGGTGNNNPDFYWGDSGLNNTTTFHNSSLGLLVGLKINLSSGPAAKK